MRRSLFPFLGSTILALGFSLVAPVLAQETVVYPGVPLQAVWGWGNADSLAPVGSDTGRSVSLSGNSVTLNSGDVVNVFGAYNGKNSDVVTNNHVFINGGKVRGGIYSGTVAISVGSGTATAMGNSVTINGGDVGPVGYITGGWAAGSSDKASASGNNVTINNGTVSGPVCGGNASNFSGNAIASDNSVTVSGGTVYGDICGGYAYSATDTASVMNNTVTIHGAPTFGKYTKLLGVIIAPSKEVFVSGNTLNLHSADLTVAKLESFQRLSFYLPATLRTGNVMSPVLGGAMLVVAGTANITGVTTVNVGLDGTGPSLKTGDRFFLIRAGELAGDIQPTSGVVGGFAYTVVKEGNNLMLVIGGAAQQPGPTRDYTGQWHNGNEDAWGLTVLQNFPGQPRYIFVPWYTYDKDGDAAWYIFQGDNWSADDTFSADVYRYTGSAWGTMPYDNNRITNTKAGTAKLTFTSATAAQFEYDVDGSSRTIDLRKLE